VKAQPVLYGVTNVGNGTISKYEAATNTLSAAFTFPALGTYPFGNVIQASNGKLYGMTENGGNKDYGVIFSFDPETSVYTKLKDFDKTNGSYPIGSLFQASNGKLYGMTQYGGNSANSPDVPGYGVIFSFDPATSIYTKLKDFDGLNGGIPTGSLIQASNGKLYGMTSDGGSSGNGVIFSFDPATSAYNKVKDFDYTNGSLPYGDLVQASNGKLYGMTYDGGNNNGGVIFCFDPTTSAYIKLKEFDYFNGDGSGPRGSLLHTSNGKLYGMTSAGGSSSNGVIFSLDPTTSVYTKLKDFDGTNGSSPYGSLMQASTGKLYGSTLGGGSSGNGVIFSFDPSTTAFTKLKDFDNVNGAGPRGSLMQAGNGKLYGLTISGGSSGNGVMFSLDPVTSAYAKVKDFGFNPNGINPSGSLVQASNGKLYGMTIRGGGSGLGVIFSFDPATSAYSKVKDFDGTNGGTPFGSLLQAKDDKLYGMTSIGGSTYDGVIFSFDPATSAYTKLTDLGGSNGRKPYGSLIQANNGKLYGMTHEGGSSNLGSIFSFDPSTSALIKLQDFNGFNGSNPTGSLVQASNGILYGVTVRGGIDNEFGFGVIFSFDPATSTFTKLKDFDDDGVNPAGNLLQATNGKLYGMTTNGGSSYSGIIFSFDPATSAYTKVKDFDGTTGSAPQGSLLQSSNGKLYGTTSAGGSSGHGVVFSFDLATSAYSTLKDFDGTNGGHPFAALIEPFPTVFYSKATGDLTVKSTWGRNTDGSGTSPHDFGAGKKFNLANRGSVYTLTTNWAVGGIINIPGGSQLQINGTTLSEAGVTGTGSLTGSATSSLIITGSFGGNAGTHYFTSGAGTLNNLTLLRTGASASATIGSALSIIGVLTVNNGMLNTGNFLTLKSNASNTARVAPMASTASITGNVTVERFIPAHRALRLLSAPVSGSQTINATWQEGVTTASPNPNPNPGFGIQITGGTIANGFDQESPVTTSIKKYNNATNAWEPVANTNATAVNSNAFSVLIAGDRTINPGNTTNAATNTVLRSRGPLKTGNQTFTVNATNLTAIGNPFASPINFATITRNNVQNNFYVLDPKMGGSSGVGAFVNVSWNGSSYDVTPASVSPESQFIQSGQGFLVRSTGVAGSIVIKETDKSATPATNVFRSANISSGLRINLHSAKSDNAVLDEVFASYSPVFSDKIDELDVIKLENINENLAMERAGTTLMVERRPPVTDNDTITLVLTNTAENSYLFEFNPLNLSSLVVSAILEDKYRHTSTPVSLSNVTKFDFKINADAASQSPYRFRVILISKNAHSSITSLSTSFVRAFPNPITNRTINLQMENQPKGRYEVQLVNALGSVVFRSIIQHQGGTATKAIQLNSFLPKGIYQLNVSGSDSKNTIKILVD
jgi:uncharacterized repeat protein (TIGR03803 family)